MNERFPDRSKRAAGVSYAGIKVLYDALFAMLAVATIMIFAPLLVRFRELRGRSGVWATLGYFLCLGLAFIGIELGLVQKFTMFLGHPVYALVVVLAAILLSSGLGSLSTGRVTRDFISAAVVRIGVLVALLLLYAFTLDRVTDALIGAPFVAKVIVAAGAAGIPAFLMGTLFPLGLAAVRERHGSLVPWIWGMNSGFSVLGAFLSLFVAMNWGYALTWMVFGAIYGLAALLLIQVRRSLAT